MRKFTRSVGMALAAVGTAAGLALSTATSAEAANKVLFVNGLGAGDLNNIAMASILGGIYGGSGYVRQNISWPAQARPVTGKKSLTLTESVNKGVTNLDAAITSAIKAGDTVTVVGLSAGALVVDDEIRKLDATPGSPDKSKLTFVVIADSSRCLFNKNRYDPTVGYQYRVPVESKYNTTVVTGEYDGYADFPDRPTNTLAVSNAIAGSQLIHIPSMLTNLSTVPAKNITVTTNAKGGVTTSYLVPTKTLPIVTLNPKLKAQEAQLRKQIDAAYIRNDPKTASAATTEAPSAAVATPDVAAATAPSAPTAKTATAGVGAAGRLARAKAAANS